MKSKKISIIIIIILLLIIGVLAFLLLKNKTKTKKPILLEDIKIDSRLDTKAKDMSSKWPTYNEEPLENYSKNITTKTIIINKKDQMVILIKNINKEKINLTTYIDFKDEKGNLIKTQKEYNYGLMPSTDNVIIVINLPEKYSSYDVRYEAEKSLISSDGSDIRKVVELIPSDDGKNISVKINNKTDLNINPEVCIAYFYDEEIQNAECISVSSYTKYKDKVKFCNYYFDKKYKGLNFNNYKVFINES